MRYPVKHLLKWLFSTYEANRIHSFRTYIVVNRSITWIFPGVYSNFAHERNLNECCMPDPFSYSSWLWTLIWCRVRYYPPTPRSRPVSRRSEVFDRIRSQRSRKQSTFSKGSLQNRTLWPSIETFLQDFSVAIMKRDKLVIVDRSFVYSRLALSSFRWHPCCGRF